jgi:hypothetical protein|tara:strand:+ start:77 stop:562 length:486 start_codon:yes stop_codon:yes gene_type:complete
MISLLGSLLGFGTSIIPEVIGFFKQKQANEQELLMLEAKAKYAEQISKLKIQELDVQAEIQETKGLYEHDKSIDAGGFINALRGSVRPVLTYMFVLAYLSTKGAMIYAMIAVQNLDWTIAIDMAWREETDGVIFASIISFWFGTRAMSKARAWQQDKKQAK